MSFGDVRHLWFVSGAQEDPSSISSQKENRYSFTPNRTTSHHGKVLNFFVLNY